MEAWEEKGHLDDGEGAVHGAQPATADVAPAAPRPGFVRRAGKGGHVRHGDCRRPRPSLPQPADAAAPAATQERKCDANERSPINLPPRKGSRQGLALSVGTAVMLNVE